MFTKLLFADDNLLVTYDCVVPEYSDRVEQCARREIGVHHRNRAAPLTQPAINFIKDIVRTQTCLDPEALEVLHIPSENPSFHNSKLDQRCLHLGMSLFLCSCVSAVVVHASILNCFRALRGSAQGTAGETLLPGHHNSHGKPGHQQGMCCALDTTVPPPLFFPCGPIYAAVAP